MLFAVVSTASVAAPAIPPEAKALIRHVHSAASSKDFAALKSLMAKEFTWSFGGDSDASQAIAEWRKDTKYLRTLSHVTSLRCAYISEEYIECPANASTEFRAGFKRMPEGWRMAYFVAGD
jgi:ketosteroid isomerase-like protein